MKDLLVARRYASALVEAVSDPAELERASVKLGELAALFAENRLLKNVMLNPAISADIKEKILDEVLGKAGAGEKVASAMRVVLKKDRMALLREIASEFEKMSFEKLGKIRVEVTSALALDENEKKIISEKLTAVTGKRAQISMSVDPSLIGGIVAKIGSLVYDGSVRNQLKALKVGLR